MKQAQQMIHLLQAGEIVSGEMVEQVFTSLMQGKLEGSQIAAILMGLSIRGEKPAQLAGAARAMRAAATHIHPQSQPLLDTCGTGGDGASTFNISTAVALVLAACGQAVAKHGNRAISSKSGSADVLEALGVRLDLQADQVAACIDQVGIGFLFAPGHHPAMRHAAPVRRDLAMRSIFNLLGPLTNPASAQFQMLGVYARDKLELVAGALQQLGVQRALVVHGRDGLDEITTTTITDAIWIEGDAPLRAFEIDPLAFGVPLTSPATLAGGDAETNAQILRHIFAGQQGAGRDIVLLNAAASLWLCGKADGIAEGLSIAANSIDSGAVTTMLDALIHFTQQAAPAS